MVAMHYSILIFLTRIQTITHADFQKHYETIHLPMLQRYGGKYFPKSHKRHYLQFGENGNPTVVQGNMTFFDFDVISEVKFDNEQGFQSFLAVLKEEETSKILRADEDSFSDRAKMKIVVIGDVLETKT
jgi:hypothetical protein